MVKSFKSDVERNEVFAHFSKVGNQPNNVQYVNGVLCFNNEPIEDKAFVARMELMFDSMEKLQVL